MEWALVTKARVRAIARGRECCPSLCGEVRQTSLLLCIQRLTLAGVLQVATVQAGKVSVFIPFATEVRQNQGNLCVVTVTVPAAAGSLEAVTKGIPKLILISKKIPKSYSQSFLKQQSWYQIKSPSSDSNLVAPWSWYFSIGLSQLVWLFYQLIKSIACRGTHAAFNLLFIGLEN